MVHRVTSIPLTPTSFKEEVQTIKDLARRNKINVNIEGMVRRKMIRKVLDSTTTIPRNKRAKKEKWVRVPYLGKFSNDLGKILKSFHIRPAYYTITNLKKIFSSQKDRVDKPQKSGVYKLKCRDCPAFYIGETGRSIEARVKEHLEAWEKNRPKKSAFAAHLLEKGHRYEKGSETLLHEESCYRRRIALENLEIVKHQKMNEDDMLNQFIPENNFIEKVLE